MIVVVSNLAAISYRLEKNGPVKETGSGRIARPLLIL